jgi:2-oxoisovalerate dehydrogenase E1 component
MLRLCSHSSADDHRNYRTPHELDADRAHDPVAALERSLIESGVLAAGQAAALRRQAEACFDRALARVSAAPAPSAEAVASHVYGAAHVSGGEEAPWPPQEAGQPVRLIDAIRNAIDEEMAANTRVVVFGEDVANRHGGVFGATRGLLDRFGPDRVFNTPLAEASIIGVGIGMAAAGWRPIAEIQFADYIFPAMMQIRNELAMLRYRSRSVWSCPLIIRAPSGGYVGGALYHSQSIEGFFTHMPGLRVVYPSNAADAKGLLKAALRGDDPVLFLEHKALYRDRGAARPEPPESAVLPFGKAAIVRPGVHVSVVTYGALVHKALAAAELLERQHGVSIEVVDLRTLNPLDIDTMVASARRTRRVIVAYEANLTGGFGAEIAACLAERCLTDLVAPIRRVAALDMPVPFAPALEARMLPQVDDLVQAARALMEHAPRGA